MALAVFVVAVFVASERGGLPAGARVVEIAIRERRHGGREDHGRDGRAQRWIVLIAIS